MAIKRRNGAWHLIFRPFDDRQVGLRLPPETVKNQADARVVESAILTACRARDFSYLDPISRECCIRMFRNQGLDIPEDMQPQAPRDTVLLFDACKMFVDDPATKTSQNRVRCMEALAHVIASIGAKKSVKDIWIQDLRMYQQARIEDGAAHSTINKEIASLSRVFGMLQDLRILDQNPCRMIKPLSTKESQRSAYLSLSTVSKITDIVPPWFARIIWTAFFSGMRRGEILGLTKQRFDMERRIMFHTASDTKEGKQKRVPIHRDLVSVLREARTVPLLGSDLVFHVQDRNGIGPVRLSAINSAWDGAMRKLGLSGPLPRFHDLRHTWRTNARVSGIDPTIAEMIMGHATRGLSVNER
jgi:integrase